jgi:hypothetical protein
MDSQSNKDIVDRLVKTLGKTKQVNILEFSYFTAYINYDNISLDRYPLFMTPLFFLQGFTQRHIFIT